MEFLCSFGSSYGYGSGFYWDPTYLLVILGVVISMIASSSVNSTMKKYKNVRSSTGMTGAMAAERILRQEGIYDVTIECLMDNSGDHYDPKSKSVRLSKDVFNGDSVTAVAVAAHECGHAIQHDNSYSPMAIRSAMVPVVNLASTLSMPLILLGVLLSWNPFLIQLGIFAFSAAVLFQLVTLPVEFNASSRALAKISQYGLLTEDENRGCKKVLRAAAFTYVAAAASTMLQLLRLILLFGGGRRRND